MFGCLLWSCPMVVLIPNGILNLLQFMLYYPLLRATYIEPEPIGMKLCHLFSNKRLVWLVLYLDAFTRKWEYRKLPKRRVHLLYVTKQNYCSANVAIVHVSAGLGKSSFE
jgi:hypothetical protein